MPSPQLSQQKARLIFEAEELSYDFGPQHPLKS